jgi:hypothetical protein
MTFEHDQAGILNGDHHSRSSPSKITEFVRYPLKYMPFRTSRGLIIAISVFVLFVVFLVTVLSLTQTKTTDKHTDEHGLVPGHRFVPT